MAFMGALPARFRRERVLVVGVAMWACGRPVCWQGGCACWP